MTSLLQEYCPFLFNLPNLSDSTLGFIMLVLSLLLMSVCLVLIVKTLRSLLEGMSNFQHLKSFKIQKLFFIIVLFEVLQKNLLHKTFLDTNIRITCFSYFSGAISRVLKNFINSDLPYVPWLTGYIAIIVGAVMTFAVQSSSVFTSAITPMVGVGLITVDRVYPLTLGANIGTTATAMLAAFASGKPESLQIALCHLLFNISGIMLFYPIPFTRIPLRMCKKLGKITAQYRWFAIFYIIVMFFVVPGIVLGLSVGGQVLLLTVLSIVFAIVIVIVIINILQDHKPNWLPAVLRDWDFLPLWMHSLKPMDSAIMAISRLCCVCRKRKEDDPAKPLGELNGKTNYGLETE